MGRPPIPPPRPHGGRATVEPMRRPALVPACALAAAVAVAVPRAARAGAPTAPVIGGQASPDGTWPDCVAVLFGGQQECTGVLIAPTLVLTAGHCADPQLDQVLIGANRLSQPSAGETIDVMQQIEYPSSQSTVDITLLILAQPSTVPPRTIASGWARADLRNGATVELVGWGATDQNANQYPDAQQEAQTTITDFDCTTSAGCNLGARPDGELGAGGMGVDTCPGDSGGPLYLVTSYGAFLAGTTSRAYDTATSYCKDGGIYERPDKILDWIEQQSGQALPRGPVPMADPLTAGSGQPGTTTVDPNDPKAGASHSFAVTTQPAHGTASVDAGGVVTYTSEDGYLGADSLEVTVSDADVPERALPVTVSITVIEGPPVMMDTGCCSASARPGAGGLVLIGAVGLLLGRRRRGRRAAR
jgi:secreted trypsin-like serine protease